MANLAAPLSQFVLKFWDGNVPAAGGSLSFFLAGTSTPQPVYADAALTTPLANPLTLDSAGVAPQMFAPAVSLKILVKNSASVTIATIDNLLPDSIFPSPMAGNLLFNPDSTYDIGSVGGTPQRPRTIYTAQDVILGRNLAVGLQTPTRQVHVFGTGQATAALNDAGATGATAYLQSSTSNSGDGGAVVLGAAAGLFAAVKGLLFDATSNTVGYLAFALRRLVSDPALTEVARFFPSGGFAIGSATDPGTGGLLVHGAVIQDGNLTVPTITADQNDYNPTGLSTARFVRLATDAARNLTGLASGTNGRELILSNQGAFNITLKNNSTLSVAGNRFNLPGGADVVLAPSQSIRLYYDGSSSFWFQT